MDFNFGKMSQKQAERVSKWHYEGEYSFYDFENDEEDLEELLSPYGDNYYMVEKDDEEVGFFALKLKMIPLRLA